MKKLGIGDTFPSLAIKLVGGNEFKVPENFGSKYGAVLFYRGHWWPYCCRQLDGFEKHQAELQEIGASVFAASTDNLQNAEKVAKGKSFQFGHSVSREHGNLVGSWWEERRQIIQPSEFIIRCSDGQILGSSYSDGPLARLDASDLIKHIKFNESQGGF